MSSIYRLVAGCAILAAACSAQAALYDEIQVYDDTLNAPGEFGLETHINTTPSGRKTPDWPGEITPHHGTRLTAEFSYGLTRTLEAGLYLPTLLDAQGNYYFAGPKLRLKWVPQAAPEGGFFYGLNFELEKLDRRFEESSMGIELRPIVGWRGRDWFFATNPVLGYSLDRGFRRGGLDFSPSLKITRKVGDGIAAGIEAYSELGKLAHWAPSAEREHTLYAVMDIEHGDWGFNVGIGRGLNPQTDRWTVKAIIEFPFH